MKIVWNWRKIIKELMTSVKGYTGKNIACSQSRVISVEQLSSHLQKDLGLEPEHTDARNYLKLL